MLLQLCYHFQLVVWQLLHELQRNTHGTESLTPLNEPRGLQDPSLTGKNKLQH
jgi:hypothetical protein